VRKSPEHGRIHKLGSGPGDVGYFFPEPKLDFIRGIVNCLTAELQSADIKSGLCPKRWLFKKKPDAFAG
jgi:hypothetical protein